MGAQLFIAINPSMPSWAGILIIGLGTVAICLFGYRIVHVYERWAWLPTTIIFLIVLGEFARSGSFVDIPPGRGASEAGSVLSFAASVFGFATAWCPYAADYTVYQPPSRAGRAIFLWSVGGLFVPLVFLEVLGAAIASLIAVVIIGAAGALGTKLSGTFNNIAGHLS